METKQIAENIEENKYKSTAITIGLIGGKPMIALKGDLDLWEYLEKNTSMGKDIINKVVAERVWLVEVAK